MTKDEQGKLDKIDQQLDKLTGYLVGLNGTDGFIKTTSASLEKLNNSFNNISLNYVTKKECNKKKNDNSKDKKYIITTVIASVAVVVATIAIIF